MEIEQHTPFFRPLAIGAQPRQLGQRLRRVTTARCKLLKCSTRIPVPLQGISMAAMAGAWKAKAKREPALDPSVLVPVAVI